ncbi:MAG: M23 family metallopeptidase [Paludibacter sp.]|jgi:murein DD-endopeptidase MepM/ murein hydrolase activator NlpD|nr:M23 family metallopeptidase [Paludibacter sp.]
MSLSLKKLLPVAFYFLSTSGVLAQHSILSLLNKKDTINVYQEMLNDESDDLMENHPAGDIYNEIWTSDHVNPYKIPIDSMPDSVRIDCSHFIVPVRGAVTSEFGPRRYRFHYGIDLRLKVGDSVRSAFSGRVRLINYEARGYGNYMVIRHDNGLETVYAHLSQVLVAPNQDVKAGELIAFGGNTGHSTGPHLHFETRYIGNAINPAHIINFNTGKVWEQTYLMTKKQSFYYQHEVKVLKSARYYSVRKGDNLGRIAARNGTSVNTLCRLNRIKPKTAIRPGQRLRVR